MKPFNVLDYTLEERLNCVEIAKHDLREYSQLGYEDLRACLAALVVVCTRGSFANWSELHEQHQKAWRITHERVFPPRWSEGSFRMETVRQAVLDYEPVGAGPIEKLAGWAGFALGSLTSLTIGMYTEQESEALLSKAWQGSVSEVAS